MAAIATRSTFGCIKSYRTVTMPAVGSIAKEITIESEDAQITIYFPAAGICCFAADATAAAIALASSTECDNFTIPALSWLTLGIAGIGKNFYYKSTTTATTGSTVIISKED